MKWIALASLLALMGCSSSDDDANGAQNTRGSDAGAGGDGTTSSSDGSTTNLIHTVMGTGGNPGHLVDANGAILQLHGVDRSGTEDTCDYGNAFDTPVDQTAVTAMKSWNVNAVRVPLNEDCWFGINHVTTGGKTYTDAIKTYVDLLTTNGLVVILDLHWAAPAAWKAQGQLGMADADHAPAFWTAVATAYGNQPNIIFDLFNEPFISDWNCWLVGGACAQDYDGGTYTAVGMATLIKTIRGAGANNVLMLGGLGYSSDFTHWVAKVNSIPTLAAPNDGISLTNIAASWHAYSHQSVETKCPSEYDGYSGTCANGLYTATNYGITGVLAAGFPVVIGEVGTEVFASNTGSYSVAQANMLDTWLDNLLTYMDGQNQSYIGWDWNTSAPPLLLTNFDGTPTPYFGATYKAHLLARPK